MKIKCSSRSYEIYLNTSNEMLIDMRHANTLILGCHPKCLFLKNRELEECAFSKSSFSQKLYPKTISSLQ